MEAPLDPKHLFDRNVAYRFSIAFQCIVNIGVRGFKSIHARVVQAGTVDVVGSPWQRCMREIQAQEVIHSFQCQGASVCCIGEVRTDAPLCRFRTEFEQDKEMLDEEVGVRQQPSIKFEYRQKSYFFPTSSFSCQFSMKGPHFPVISR